MTLTGPIRVPQEVYQSLRFLPAALAEGLCDGPFVAVVRSRDSLCRWLRDPLPGLQWIRVDRLLSDPDAWLLFVRIGISNESER